MDKKFKQVTINKEYMKSAIVIDWIGFSYGIYIDVYLFQKTIGCQVIWVSCHDEETRTYRPEKFQKVYDKLLSTYDRLYFIETEFFGFLLPGQKAANQQIYFLKNLDISPVVDWTTYYQGLRLVDAVIARTRSAETYYKAAQETFGYNYRIISTKFTSLDYSKVMAERVHFQVANPFKGQEAVIIPAHVLLLKEIPLPILEKKSNYAGSFLSFGRKNLPMITSFWNEHQNNVALPKLYIKSYCENGEVKEEEMGNLAACRANPKIEILDRYISESEKAELYNQCTFFINASPSEGYGHNINEARSTGRIILVFDREPMNELIDADCGIIMSSIGDGVSRALQLSEEEISRKMKRTRERYVEDTEAFQTTFRKMSESNNCITFSAV